MARQISKKAKRKTPKGIVHIQASFNNTIITITTLRGEVISWSSAGACGFRGARKGTCDSGQAIDDAGNATGTGHGEGGWSRSRDSDTWFARSRSSCQIDT
jgi:hypothetical protein